MKKTAFRGRLAERAGLMPKARMREFGAQISSLKASGRAVVDLASGFPDLPAALVAGDGVVGDMKVRGFDDPLGSPTLRGLIAGSLESGGIILDADRNITVAGGATEAINATMLATINPGDEVIIFEPFYDRYLMQVALAGGVPRFVRLKEPFWRFDERDLRRAVTRRTRAILVNSPHNPTGRVFSVDELAVIARVAQDNDLLVISDETYGAMAFDGRTVVSIAALPGMAERTVVVGGFTKTMTTPGWRLGYLAAPDWLSEKARAFLALTSTSPAADRQSAAIASLSGGDLHRDGLNTYHEKRRAELAKALDACGFTFAPPEGATFFFADCSSLGVGDDRAAWRYLLDNYGLATLPGRCFFRAKTRTNRLRFCFSRKEETLVNAVAALAPLYGGKGKPA